MAKFMNFNAHVQSVFENDESKYVGFQSLLHDATIGKGEVEGYSKKEVNDKIVQLLVAMSIQQLKKSVRLFVEISQLFLIFLRRLLTICLLQDGRMIRS